jgi:peroxisome-assembly ATPase
LRLGSNSHGRGDVFAGNGEFGSFLEVLKARCEIWDMEGGRDWRRRDAEETGRDGNVETMRGEMIEGCAGLEKMNTGNLGLEYEQSVSDKGNQAASPGMGGI